MPERVELTAVGAWNPPPTRYLAAEALVCPCALALPALSLPLPETR